LWRGFSQITRTTPRLLITLHFEHIGLTDDLTFISKTSLSYQNKIQLKIMLILEKQNPNDKIQIRKS